LLNAQETAWSAAIDTVEFITPSSTQRTEAEQILRSQGDEIVPLLIQMLREVLPSASLLDRLRETPDYWPVCKLADFLAGYGFPQATDILVTIALRANIPGEFMPGSRALRAHLELLKSQNDYFSVAARILAIERLLGHQGYTGDVLQLAEGLVLLAERQPLPILSAALPVLRPGWRKPPPFHEFYMRLQTALGEGDLPIPVTTSPQEADLPIPTQEELP
jgi:hypothetical protein